MMLKTVLTRYRTYLADRNFLKSLLVSALLFAVSMVFIFYAIGYATRQATGSNYVTDIVLSNTVALDVGWLFVFGTFLFFLIGLAVTFVKPNRIPFVLSTIALFFFIRGIFISITHLAPFPLAEAPDPATIFSRIFYGSDQFFSGHTGVTFLLALIFWEIPPLRFIFLGWSLFFATIVMLGHLHYSIDVLAAFFITYTIYHIALWLFPHKRALFYL